ncbi:hypothetical protein LCGC14_2266960 [marine sediment metagenome]|uniref:Uncharacterized protein n=1 Tax=marine sediment metagenome TaxID=412755 RepID=A0A0F9CY65_9ZZZZ
MAVISITDYRAIMTNYADAQTQLVGISDEYYNAAYTVLNVNVFNPEIDLLVAFHNAYVVSQGAYASAPISAVNAVNALQNHILNQSVSVDGGSGITAGDKYDDINDYYSDYPASFALLIPQAFATISGQAGHTIDSAHITP